MIKTHKTGEYMNFLIRVLRKLYYGPKAVLGRVFFGSDRVLNDGERYDPFLSSFSHKDMSHLPRYEFAANYLTASDTVLDVACGTGYGTEILAAACKKAVGIDKSKEAITYAKQQRNSDGLEFIEDDFFEHNVTADVVVSFETIEHIIVPDMDTVLLKLLSSTRSKIIGSVPYKEKKGSNPHHYFFDLDEGSLDILKNDGELKFFYQNPSGEISSEKPNEIIQNLIFIFTRTADNES